MKTNIQIIQKCVNFSEFGCMFQMFNTYNFLKIAVWGSIDSYL